MAGFRTDITGADTFALQSALSAYTDEAYTSARKLSGTGIVGDNPLIDTGTETFVGQMRWFKPLTMNINIASLDTATDGTVSTYSSAYLKYIKSVRTYGASKVNMQQIVTQVDGLAKIARDFAEVRAQDEHNAIMAVLRGVAITEALYGAGVAGGGTGLGGQSWVSDPEDKKYGFYVDLSGSSKELITAIGKDQSGTANAAYVGAARAEGLLQAFGMAFKDYEPPYAYLLTSPEVMASLRTANLVDSTKVTEGNMDFSTIFNGKFRIIQTRASQSLSGTELTRLNEGAGVNFGSASAKTSFIVLPGALAMKPLLVPEPVEITRDGAKYKGGGVTNIWHRWGYVVHPAGYDWVGGEDAFPSDAMYSQVKETATWKALGSITATTGADNTSGTWARKATSALSLGILPIFHD